MNKNIKISIIIPNFNGEQYLKTCLSSLLKSSYRNFEVILIDDNSTDKSLGIIKEFQKKDERITFIKNKNNSGAAASKNRGIRIAKGEIIVFLDNDTEVTKDWLKNLVKPLLEEKEVGGAQSMILDFKNRDLIQNGGGVIIPEVAWIVPFYQKQKYSKIKKTLETKNIIGISASLAIKKEIADKIGGFDEKEAIYTEDLDFCWRTWIAGYRIVLAPDSKIFHWTKSVEKRGHMNASYRQIYFHLAKNSFRSILKNYELTNVLKYLPVSILINVGRGFLFLLSRKTVDALAGSFEAVIWLFFNLSDTLKARKAVQMSRKFTDGYLLKKIFTSESLIKIYNKYYK